MRDRLALLIVADSEDDAILVVRELERGGFAPDWVRVETPAELASTLASRRWDVVLADYNLPWPPGPTPLDIVRQSGFDVPFLVVSDCVGEATAVELIRAGADDVVAKNNLDRIALVVRRETRDARSRAERRRAEDALRHSEERYRKLFEEASDAIFIVEKRSGRYLDANRAAERLTGRTAHDLRTLATRDVAPGWVTGRSGATFEPSGTQELGEVDYVRPDGSVRTALLSIVHINDDVLYGIAHDITERKQAAEALRRSEERLRRLAAAIEQSEEGVMITDQDGVIEYVNPAFEHITGYPPDEVLQQSPRILRSGRQDTVFYAQMWNTIKSGRTWSGRLINRRKDGTPYHQDCTISPVLGADGRIERFVAAMRDVTKSLQLEEDLRQSQRVESLGRLAAVVAHDFNNLLSPILGYAELLLAAMHPSDDRCEQLREIELAARRARDLTRQLLAFGRKQALQVRAVDLNAIDDGIEQLLRRALREDIVLTVVSHPQPCVVMADPRQIEQVLMNLVVNAQDAMPGGGRVTVRVEALTLTDDDCTSRPGTSPGRYGVLVVSDTGSGMDTDTRRRIFEPFFSTKGERGTGLGLSTVYGIVKQHGGHVCVDSEIGRGTVFEVYLPATDAEPAADRGPAPATVRLPASATILLVEDNESVRQLAETVLRREGYTVLAAVGGAEAVALLDGYEGTVQLLLTDVIMSGMDGRALQRVVEKRCPNVKVLFMSGYTDDVMADRGVLHESVPFVQKPFSVVALAEKVREVLES